MNCLFSANDGSFKSQTVRKRKGGGRERKKERHSETAPIRCTLQQVVADEEEEVQEEIDQVDLQS